MRKLGLKRWQVQVFTLVLLLQLGVSAQMYTTGDIDPIGTTIAVQLFGLGLTLAAFLVWNTASPRLSKMRRRARFSKFWSKKAAPIIAYTSLALGVIILFLTPGARGAVGSAFVASLPAVIFPAVIIQAGVNALDYLGI